MEYEDDSGLISQADSGHTVCGVQTVVMVWFGSIGVSGL
jgi:hypothetical protein